jgi:hypothetical protein
MNACLPARRGLSRRDHFVTAQQGSIGVIEVGIITKPLATHKHGR